MPARCGVAIEVPWKNAQHGGESRSVATGWLRAEHVRARGHDVRLHPEVDVSRAAAREPGQVVAVSQVLDVAADEWMVKVSPVLPAPEDSAIALRHHHARNRGLCRRPVLAHRDRRTRRRCSTMIDAHRTCGLRVADLHRERAVAAVDQAISPVRLPPPSQYVPRFAVMSTRGAGPTRPKFADSSRIRHGDRVVRHVDADVVAHGHGTGRQRSRRHDPATRSCTKPGPSFPAATAETMPAWSRSSTASLVDPSHLASDVRSLPGPPPRLMFATSKPSLYAPSSAFRMSSERASSTSCREDVEVAEQRCGSDARRIRRRL